jgi:two-component system chemotaxis sensor kinase CheA
MIEHHIATYREEAYELLAELETSLLELEENPAASGLIGRVFRAMHTIKGSGAMFGFDEIARFTHEVETIFDLVRNGKLAACNRLLNLTLRARDHIKALLDASVSGAGVDRSAGESIIAGLKQLVPSSTENPPQSPFRPQGVLIRGEAVKPPFMPQRVLTRTHTTGLKGGLEGFDAADEQQTWRICFKPLPGILLTGTRPPVLFNELRELGACHVIAHSDQIPLLPDLVPEQCYLYWDIILTTTRGRDAIRDVFIFVEDDCDLRIDLVDGGGQTDRDQGYKKLGDILVERGDLSPVDMHTVLGQQKRFGELAVAAGVVTPDKVQSALAEQQHVKNLRQERAGKEAATSIRVPAERLDTLINLVGELVTIQARFTRTAQVRDDEEFIAIAEEVERLTVELRDNTLNIRMLPIGTTFSKFKRLVRDLSQELGKQIEMTTSGGETELDKTVIEKLSDPLVHLIRNSIDHGIELLHIREEQGKLRQGTIHLSAIHSGDSVLITIKDDGAGLDRDAILAKALERGLVSAGAELSDQEIFSQIFAPGFSTAKQVTSVSGRGVGMDVVKKAIDALRGTISVSSVRGKGTAITVRIPLTLAIIESLLVQVGADSFVMPLSLVSECIELTADDVAHSHGRNLARVRGSIVPYIPLRERFGIEGQAPELQQIVIMAVEERQVGFVVDQVIGEHQTVIKSLGKYYQHVQGVSGATILGDGTVALILDIPMLIQSTELLEHSEFQGGN